MKQTIVLGLIIGGFMVSSVAFAVSAITVDRSFAFIRGGSDGQATVYKFTDEANKASCYVAFGKDGTHYTTAISCVK